ncbi:16S rRNA (guanine(966)-N(2))-methyltransferase RsmD [Heliobacterium gestii]|uniref:16S rRNA (Guanine(966)-N(2))-methyltransferase RsmD n=1 Tax=Heliomicrobium gestii TaxID=2699 RepID=A0A845LGK6_HELGE|nr:16S rRNA (guanine(966)-N(2))-methyltransferase RsmD [Heliomicrobium gestii]MBM7867030.1 16S rRNA (guanine(966)-N(2))-methyltransferase RsmD [Heliomicrobium gestii]MZP43555.1 16S rRNA (guanine(966)-N(2))-methyltransferase RsmD [Heliomicrobium gestii]
MRIISGQARGHRLVSVKGWETRPTADRVKEALFNVLAGRCLEAQCLDLFAGTGALGLEALSRGAAFVYWVEKNPAACATIVKNIQSTRLDRGKVLKQDVRQACQRLLAEGKRFDLIFADPPYKRELWLPVLEMAAAGLLAPEGVLIMESSRDEGLPEQFGSLSRRKQDRYGDTMIHYYQWERSPEPDPEERCEEADS